MTDELFPAYIALIRYELKLLPRSDALAELTGHLSPENASEKPPARAPGIMRLQKALRNLQAKSIPDMTLGEFAADLQFLQLFSLDEPVLGDDAMERLLADVNASTPASSKPATPIARFATNKKADT